MPSATSRHYDNARSPISLPFLPTYRPDDVLISPWSKQALGDHLGAEAMTTQASGTYPAASRVLAYPFALCDPFLCVKVWWHNGTTATTDTADVGVYTEDGTTLLLHGSAAIATANVVQEVDITDVLLPPGRYWAAYIQGGTTATPLGFTPAAAQMRVIGCAQQAGSGSALGSTFTPAAIAGAFFPYFGIAQRTQVA